MWERETGREENTCGTLMPPLHVSPPSSSTSIIIVFIITTVSMCLVYNCQTQFPGSTFVSDKLSLVHKISSVAVPLDLKSNVHNQTPIKSSGLSQSPVCFYRIKVLQIDSRSSASMVMNKRGYDRCST